MTTVLDLSPFEIYEAIEAAVSCLVAPAIRSVSMPFDFRVDSTFADIADKRFQIVSRRITLMSTRSTRMLGGEGCKARQP